MKALLLTLALILSPTSHAASKHRPAPVTPEPTASPAPSITPQYPPLAPISSPSASGWNFSPVTGTTSEIKRVSDSQVAIEKVKASSCFSDYFLSRALIQTNGLSRQGVIDFIRKTPGTAPVVYYYANNGTVGYRQPPSSTIYVNRKFHNGYGVCAEGSGNGHEMLHVLGFDHDYNRTARRPYSVPYSWNAMFDYCCPIVMGGEL